MYFEYNITLLYILLFVNKFLFVLAPFNTGYLNSKYHQQPQPQPTPPFRFFAFFLEDVPAQPQPLPFLQPHPQPTPLFFFFFDLDKEENLSTCIFIASSDLYS